MTKSTTTSKSTKPHTIKITMSAERGIIIEHNGNEYDATNANNEQLTLVAKNLCAILNIKE